MYDQHPGKDQRDPIQYFTPGKVVLHFEHPAGLPQDSLQKMINAYLRERSWGDNLQPVEAGSILTFPGKEQGPAFSIVTARMREEPLQEDLVELLQIIYYDLKNQPPQPINTFQLKSVAPDWLIGSSYHGAGLGGPGKWPDPGPVPDGKWPQFTFPGINEYLPAGSDWGAGVHIAILDTMPCVHDLVDAYEKWRAPRGTPKKHPLLESLLKPGGPLHLYPASFADLAEVMDYSAAGHRYRMDDHGLFVAGIIHTIAPKATLHWYEVLNHYGIGSLESIARGLMKVSESVQRHRSSGGDRLPHIVNCSLVLGVTRDGEEDLDLPDNLRDKDLLSHMRISFNEIVASLAQPDVQVVAAAGNDAETDPGKPGGPARPAARYPAAYDSVIGVGALAKDSPRNGPHKIASYSNLADEPAERGYVILGGEKGPRRAVQGLFLHQFPKNNSSRPEGDKGIKFEDISYEPQDPNQGWAWWAGTSFATPILSGLLAAWWSVNPGGQAVQAIDFLNTLSPGHTDDNERVIYVEEA